MSIDELSQDTKGIKSKVEDIVGDNLDYYKLLGFKTVTKTTSGLVKLLVVSLVCLLILFLLSLAGGFALSTYFGSYVCGFLAMAGIVLLILLLFLGLSRFLIDRPILRKFSEIFHKD